MTLDRLRPLADRAHAPVVRASIAIGLTPDAISVLAFGLAAVASIGFGVGGRGFLVGAVLVVGSGLLDLLDGRVARTLEVASASGDLLDHVLDRYADVVLIAGLAVGVDRYDLGLAAVTGVLLTSYLGTQAEAVGLSRVYGGLVGRADRLALIGLAAALQPFVEAAGGVPGPGPHTPVGWLLVVLAVVGHLTALQRFASAWHRLD